MGLNSVSVDERNGSNDQIQDPKTLVFVTLNALVITKNCDAATDTVIIYVNETLLKETHGSVNCFKRRQGDGDGKGRGDAVSDCGKEFFFHGATMGDGPEGVKRKIKNKFIMSGKVRIHWGKCVKNF